MSKVCYNSATKTILDACWGARAWSLAIPRQACWYSMFYDNLYHLVYSNEQQMYLTTLWFALIFQYINSLNIVQFVMRMRSNKNRKMRHSRKEFCGLEGFSINPWIFKIFTHNGYCFYFSNERAKIPGSFINLGWLSHVLGHQLLLGC